MKIYIIVGEASGDHYGAKLMESISKQEPSVSFRFWGGDKMLKHSKNIAKHIRETAFMGFLEVLQNLRTIKSNLAFCKKDILEFKPDLIIFIDYPGFNLRIAKWAKSKDFKTSYVIPPKVWAWKESRVEKLRKYIDKIFVIFPFEVPFYKSKNLEVQYLGNPLYEEISDFRSQQKQEKKEIIALLPGSRKQEIFRHLSIMIQVANSFEHELFEIIVAPNFTKDYYLGLHQDWPKNIKLSIEGSWKVLNRAKAAIVCSGTATLETALFDVPQVVMYKSSAISMAVAKCLVELKYISLVNLIVDKPLVKELIQDKASLNSLGSSLQDLLNQKTSMYSMLYDTIKSKSVIKNIAKELLRTFR